MRTAQQRLLCMHERAAQLSLRRERAAARAWGGISAALSACLLGLAAVFPAGHGLGHTAFAGASLLSEAAGGYVLAAVLAFLAGAAVAVYVQRRKRPRGGQHDPPQ